MCAANSCLCAEISCGPPLNLPNTNPLWDGRSRPGSVVLYECRDGFYPENGTNMSTCSQSGEWGKVSAKCQGRAIISTHGHIERLFLYQSVWGNVKMHPLLDSVGTALLYLPPCIGQFKNAFLHACMHARILLGLCLTFMATVLCPVPVSALC